MSRPGEIANFTKDKSALYKKRLLGWLVLLVDVAQLTAECACLASL